MLITWESSRQTPVGVGLSVTVACLASVGPLPAQDRASLRAQAVAGAITVDAQLDEPAWARAGVASAFRQFEPTEGAPASQRTEVRVLYGESSLYVGAVLHDPDPGAIERTLGRRDEFNRADWFLASIDAHLDRRTAYTFAVNAAGVQFDAVQGGGGGPGGGGEGGGGGPTPQGMDPSWDAIWSSEVRVTPEGWVVEIAIPYSMLRFPRAPSQTWGVQFSRHVPRLGEESEWPLVPRIERSNQVARFANLTGIAGIEPRRNVQVEPYSVGRMRMREDAERPGATDRDSELDLGADVKVGLGPNVTLNATLNPDFGQVESDPAVLNLTAFETLFEERRPFFVEGSQIFEFEAGPGQLLYTRRIGAAAPIIGAAKVSGRTARGLSFGVLGATTGDDFRPERHYGVVRASQQFGGYSTAGGILTLYDSPADEGRGRSVAAGADWDLRRRDNRYGLEGFAAVTNRWWTDAGRASETGFAAKLWARKRQGAWQGFGGVEVFTDDFDPNDVGELQSNNAYVLIGSLEHEINGNRPFGPFQRANVELFGVQRFAYADRLNQGLSLELSSRGVLRGFQTVEANVDLERPFGGYDLFETRGAGSWAAPATLELQFEIGSDERRTWEVEPEVGLTLQEGGGHGYSAGLRGNWRVSDRLSLEGNLDGEWEDGVVAWSSNETFLRTDAGWHIARRSGEPADADPSDYVAIDDAATLGAILAEVPSIGADRYFVPVFGARDTRSTDLTLRGTYTFTPDLSVQLYGQLFLATGRYRDMTILRTRDELAPFDAFPKRDEFALSSVQSNAVLRWEYHPGSTLYVVWTHGRGVEDELDPLGPSQRSPFARSVGRQIADAFDVFPDNLFLVKFSYTFLN